MRGLLADANFEGHLQQLQIIWNSTDWIAFWEDLELSVLSFAELDLDSEASDDIVWRRCQQERLALVTANRNYDDSSSLEAMIRNDSREDSLPVFTVGSVQRMSGEREYVHRVAIDLLEYLIQFKKDPHSLLGSGRLYVPKSV